MKYMCGTQQKLKQTGGTCSAEESVSRESSLPRSLESVSLLGGQRCLQATGDDRQGLGGLCLGCPLCL